VRADVFVERLRRLRGDDLRSVWSFCKDRYADRERVAFQTAKASGSTVAEPDALSGASPVFGLVSVEDVRGQARDGVGDGDDPTTGNDFLRRGDGHAGDDADHLSKPSKGGSKKKGKRGKSGARETEEEWFPNEKEMTLRLSRGVWFELYGDSGCLKDASPTPNEHFLGEHLLRWIFDETTDVPEEGSVSVSGSAFDEPANLGVFDERVAGRISARAPSLETIAKRLESNASLVARALSTKLNIRRLTDACVVLAGRLFTDVESGGSGSVRDLNPSTERGRLGFRAFWRRCSFLKSAACDLRRALLVLDLEEIKESRAALERAMAEMAAEYKTLEALQSKTREEASAAEKKETKTKKRTKTDAEREQKADARRLKILASCEVRIDALQRRWNALKTHDVPLLDRSSNGKTMELNRLESSAAAKEVVIAQANDGSREARCSKLVETKIEDQLRRWIENDGEVPHETLLISATIARVPMKLAMPLCLAQERLAKLDLQMEAAQLERAEAVAAAAAAAGSRDGAWTAQVTALAVIRERLLRLAASAAADAAVAEQERLLAEEGEASEARRAKEEKAKAKRAKEKARAKEAKAAEDEAKAAAAAAAAEEEAVIEAKAVAARDAAAAARAAARRDA